MQAGAGGDHPSGRNVFAQHCILARYREEFTVPGRCDQERPDKDLKNKPRAVPGIEPLCLLLGSQYNDVNSMDAVDDEHYS